MATAPQQVSGFDTEEGRRAYVEAEWSLRGKKDDKVWVKPATMELFVSWGAAIVSCGKQVGSADFRVLAEIFGKTFVTVVGRSSSLLRQVRH